MRLLAYSTGDTYKVTLGSVTCTTPCTLPALPGVAALHTEGAGEVDGRIVIPPQPGVIRVRHHDRASQAAGVVLVPTGLLLAGGGWVLGETCAHGSGYDTCRTAQRIVWPIVGVAALTTGIVLLVRGRRPPPDANRVLLTGAGGAPSVRLTSLDLRPLLGGAQAGVGLAF